MKKSIRVAAALCAVVVGLSALLAGCENDDEEPSSGPSGLGGTVGENGDSEEPSSGPESLGGTVGENPFKELTLVHEHKGSYQESTTTYSFASDTKGVHRYEYLNFDDDEDSENSYAFQGDFEYAVDSGRNMLKLRTTSYTADGETQTVNDKYLAEVYGNLDNETKSLLYDSFIEYIHYDFVDDDTVVLDSDYYFGSLAESSARFRFHDGQGVSFTISNHMWFEIFDDDDDGYDCYPKFANDGSFTAVAFRFNSASSKYEKLSTRLVGTCQITSTGTDGSGTVKFTQIPAEMKANAGLVLGKEYLLSQASNYPESYTIQK